MTADHDAPARGSGLKRLGLAVLAVALAFGAGAAWQYFRAEDLAQELERTRLELRLEMLEGDLASTTIDAQFGRFESARQRASRFFSDLEAVEDAGLPDSIAGVVRLLDSRDDVITSLSRANPQSAAVLGRLYRQFQEARGQDTSGMREPQAPPAAQPADSPADTTADTTAAPR